MSATTEQTSPTPTAIFERILCVAELAPYGPDAVRQAASLAGPGATIDLVSVAPRRSPGMPRPQAAQIEALVTGTALAASVAVECAPHIVEATDDADGVLESCSRHDLIVAPAGDTALDVLSRAPVSVLLSRPSPAASPFPESILVASDGTGEAHTAVRLGAELAARHGSVLALVATPEHDASHQRALEDDIQTVVRITGKRPLLLDEYRGAVSSILAAAASVEASVIVMGRRPGHPGRSVSAEVATAAPCSVLVVRAG